MPKKRITAVASQAATSTSGCAFARRPRCSAAPTRCHCWLVPVPQVYWITLQAVGGGVAGDVEAPAAVPGHDPESCPSRRRRAATAGRCGRDTPWATMTYAGALRQVRAAASWILAQELSAERPVVVLSDNSVDHALLALACPSRRHSRRRAISPAYSLVSRTSPSSRA